MDLIDRKYGILQAIIDDYILTALPVGSRTISRKYEQKLSSATIRNEMSDLEELGYLDSPHTSAGRVPSNKAYRLYVDRMLRPAPLSVEETAFIRSCFDSRVQQVEEMTEGALQRDALHRRRHDAHPARRAAAEPPAARSRVGAALPADPGDDQRRGAPAHPRSGCADRAG